MPTSQIPEGMVESHDLDGNRILEPRTKGQLTIESDGNAFGTSITVDGVELTGVTSATWSVSVDEVAKATVTFDSVVLKLTTGTLVPPSSREQRAIDEAKALADANDRLRA